MSKWKNQQKPAPQYQSYLNIRLELIRENPVECIQIKKAEDVVCAFKDDFSKLPNEVFRSIHLNCKNYVLGIETISVGSATCSIVHPREVFKGAIINNSTSLILVHNHPSGDPTPSRDDIEITNRLVNTGQILGIKVLDHIIFGCKEIKPFFSFADQKLI